MIALLHTAVLASALVAAQPQENVAADQVDLIELNHYYDEQGKPVFRQLIFYDWDKECSRFNVRAWRLIKKQSQLPQQLFGEDGDVFLCIWEDGDTLRKVVAPQLRKTWTQYDPELVERSHLPKEDRLDLVDMTPE